MPESRRLILLRHGVTAWNSERRFQGQADVELTEDGHAQAKVAAEALAPLSPTALWTSDLSRAVATARHVGEAAGLTPVLDARLREIHVGAFQGLTYPEVVQRFGDGSPDFAEHGGETESEVGERFAACLHEVAAALGDRETAIVVAHGGAIRFGLAAFLGWPRETSWSLAPLANCGWVELAEAARGLIDPTASWRLTAYGLTG